MTSDLFLFQDGKRFDEILKTLKLQKRGAGGVDTVAEGGLFDISNADRLGFSEVCYFVHSHAHVYILYRNVVWRGIRFADVIVFCVQVQLVQQVVDGVNLLVEMEKKLEKGESIDSLMPKKK